ncbi:hypothetical protein ACFE04_018721 [Oxalis oulophora]
MQLCTLEFKTRRASYYSLLEKLGLFQSYVWEYSRLNATNAAVLSLPIWKQGQSTILVFFTGSGVDPLKVEILLFDKLFVSKSPAELEDWHADLNPNSKVVVIPNAYAVPALKDAAVWDRFQFERAGYFMADKDSSPENLIFNRIVTLRDSYGGKGGK